jgi:hypothetical protein
MRISRFAVLILAASISLTTDCAVSSGAWAQLSRNAEAGTMGDTNSNSSDGVPIAQGLSGSAPAGNSEATGIGILDDKGDLFMEEVPDNKPRKPIQKVPIDLSRVGVSVDPRGQIVPLKDAPTDSWAGTGVKPFQNEISNTFQPLFQYGNLFGSPYGYGPGYPGYSGYPYYGPGYPGYSGYPYYGPGYPGYSGYPYYGPGYWSQPALSFRIGKFQAAIGSVPLPGINPYFSDPTVAYPAAAYPAFTGPAFTYPGNTTYTQSSMWRAFNLAF